MSTYVSPTDALASVVGPASMKSRTTNAASVTKFTTQALGRERRPSSAISLSDIRDVQGEPKDHTGPRYAVAIIAIIVVGIACAAVSLTVGRDATIPTARDKPIDGLTIFAVFFVAAMSIERLLEPLSNAILPKADRQRQAHTAKTDAGHEILTLGSARSDYRRLIALPDEFQVGSIDAQRVQAELNRLAASDSPFRAAAATALGRINSADAASGNWADATVAAALRQAIHTAAEPSADEASRKLKDAADLAEALSVHELLRATTFWLIATCLGMLVAATMRLYFLNTIGITAGEAWQEILATGLIIGAGTKPLHDLIKLMSKSGAAGAVGA